MPKTILPDPRVQPRFAGISTFCRYPRLADVLPENRPIDWLLYGVPFDGGVTFRPGARFAPRSIREASQYIKRYSLEHRVDVCELLSIADAGDAPLSPYELKTTLDMVSEFALGLADDDSDDAAPPAKLLAVGGDHSIAYANIRATYQARGEPAGGLPVVHFDAHLDTVDTVWNCRWGHASPFRRAIEEGLINPMRMLSIGIRGPLNNAADLEFADKAGITVLTTDDILSGKAAGALVEFVASRKGDELYCSFDVDVVDPAFAPGTGTPACGGPSSAQVLTLVRSMRGAALAGADVVEVLPDRDVAGITALLAGQVMFELLALDAAARVKP